MSSVNQPFDISEVKQWYYAGEADITYGEVHASKVPKILLAITLLTIIGTGIFVYLNKDYIYDYIVNPQIELKSEVKHADGNYTEIEIYNSGFDPIEYISNLNNKYTYDIESNVNINELGEYQVIYNSYNNAFSNSVSLTVIVKDSSAPVIKLKNAFIDEANGINQTVFYDENSNTYTLGLIRGKDTQFFDPSNYIDSVSDNYTSSDKLSVTYTDNYSLNVSTFSIVYKAIDEQGNEGTISLIVSIFDDIAAMEEASRNREEALQRAIKELEDKINATPTPTPSPIPTPSPTPTPKPTPVPTTVETKPTPTAKDTKPTKDTDKPTKEPKDPNVTQNLDGTDTPGDTTITPTPTPTPDLKSGEPYIGANPVTISMSELGSNGISYIMTKCSNEIYYVNDTSFAMPKGLPGIDFQIKPGVYEVVWETQTGLSCIQIVTITE